MNSPVRKGVLVTGFILLLCCLALLMLRKSNYKVSSPSPSEANGKSSQQSPSVTPSKEQPSKEQPKPIAKPENPPKKDPVKVTAPPVVTTQAPTPPPTAPPTPPPTPRAPPLTTQQPPVLNPPLKHNQIPSLSKDLIVHSSYFDSRPRNGHSNVTVLFVNVNRTILDNKWILGCGGEGVRAKDYEVYSIFENVLMHNWLGPKPVIYENEMILCYDLPVRNGSSVYAVYKPSADSTFEYLSYSRKPLFFPAPRVKPRDGEDFTVVVCSKAHNINAPWIKEFIQYQRTLGVDHVDFSVLDSFIKDDGYDKRVLNDPVVRDALRDGFINFRVWPETYEKNGEAYFHSENLRKLACIYRYIGTYDYVMPLDTDDFFNPVGPSKKLKDYIRQHCYTKPAASCRFNWVRFYPDCGNDGNIGPEGNVTAHLNVQVNTFQNNFKSVHSTKAILDASFHDARCQKCLAPGYKMISIPQSIAYVAHIRFGMSDDWKKKICH